MAQQTENTAYQWFGGTGTDTVTFSRSVNTIIITTSGSVQYSLDGTNFVPMADGTHQFVNLSLKKLYFLAGTWEGFGVAL